MIPLRDTIPSRTFPFVTYSIIAVNVFIFFFELSLGEGIHALFQTYGLVPAQLVNSIRTFDLAPTTILPVFTSMFLHGGWMHLIGNMLFLHIFGDNVEDRLGHFRYLIFYLLCGIGAAALQIVINPLSTIPMVGASGAIAGVLGAYVLLYPYARILTLVPAFFFFFPLIEVRAFFFLGFWFMMQVVSGLLSLGIGGDAGGVAWWAHIGGFVCGALFLPFMKKRRW